MEAQVRGNRRNEDAMSHQHESDAISESDLDALMEQQTRAEVQALISEGRSFIPVLADWGRRARPLLDHPFPEAVHEDQELNAVVMRATGLAELNDMMFLIGLVGADPDSAPSDAVVNRLLDQYADLVGLQRTDCGQ
jgi:hypothetical protein